MTLGGGWTASAAQRCEGWPGAVTFPHAQGDAPWRSIMRTLGKLDKNLLGGFGVLSNGD